MSELELAKARARIALATSADPKNTDGTYGQPPEGYRLDLKTQQMTGKPFQRDVGDYVAQAGAGSQEGIAQTLGFPVDAVTDAINGVGQLTGLWGPIENPVGGSESIDRLMRPIRKNVPEPQTAGERISKRVGEEVGASVAAAPAAFASKMVRANPMRFARVEGASALGSGVGAAAANEVAPNNTVAEIAGQLLGGMGAGRVVSRGSPTVTRGGIDEQRAIASDAYGRVRADRTQIPQQHATDLADQLKQRMASERMKPKLQSGASAILESIVDDAADGSLSRIEDYEDIRRMTMRNLPANATPEDRRLAQIMKDQITNYIDNIGGDSAQELRAGRNAHRRAEAASAVQTAAEQAQRSAATTGSGGNEINRMRQKLRSIIESPRKARSFTADELKAMDEIAQGNVSQNLLRRLSRFAPTSGGLSAMLGIGGTMASPEIAVPVVAATEVAKKLGERSTRASVDALMESLAPSRILQPGDNNLQNIVAALLAARANALSE